MNSLKFIEKQIKNEQSIIKTYEEYFKIDKTECDKQLTRGYIQIHQKNIDSFNQIKTILEAWEELKKYIVLMEEQYPLYDTTYEYIELENGCIDESNTDEEGKSIMIIKRALEINYESEE